MSSSVPKKHYDLEKKNKAVTGFGFRALVAGYLVYLAAQVLKSTLKGESPIPTGAVIAIFVLFVGAALAFLYYAWREFQKALKEAECTTEEMQAELAAAEAAENAAPGGADTADAQQADETEEEK